MIHVGDGTEVGTRILDFIVGHILVFPMLQFYFLSSIGFLFLSSVLNKTTNCGGLQHPVPWLLTGVFMLFSVYNHIPSYKVPVPTIRVSEKFPMCKMIY